MNGVLETLFYPVTQGLVAQDLQDPSCAFLSAEICPELENFQAGSLFLQQNFKPYASVLQERGYTVSSEISCGDDTQDIAFVALPKNVQEARYLTAQALRILKPDGHIICAADNKAGGKRIQKMLQDFECKSLQEFSKNKARVVWGRKADTLNEAVQKSLQEGEMQDVLDGKFKSIPGVFGWNKIDVGSQTLVQHLPDTLEGSGADFGCGYGYLSHYILQHCPNVTHLSCIDADYRAIKLSQENLKHDNTSTQLRYFWEDLTMPLSGLRDLDFIVMNPPFHEGKKTDTGLGVAFIKTAVYTLRPGGKLWMVANVALPYEDVLASTFSCFENVFEGGGFKIFCAVK